MLPMGTIGIGEAAEPSIEPCYFYCERRQLHFVPQTFLTDGTLEPFQPLQPLQPL